jgi:nitrogen fixation/metabolism regulation signal transduction histidine kinase
MTATFRRKKYLVERGLQFRFTRFVLLFVFFSCLLTGLAIFFTTFMLMGEKLAAVYPQGRLVSIFRSVYVSALFSLLAVIPFIGWMSIKFSHRIAGPLPKIYQALRNIGDGQFDVKLVLRKGDELQELADAINETARKLKERTDK